jgi:hypothetical protein
MNAARLAVAVVQDMKADDVAQWRELSTERVVGSRVFCKKEEKGSGVSFCNASNQTQQMSILGKRLRGMK